MGKPATATKISEKAMEASGNLPVVQENARPPAFMDEYAAEDAGQGVSEAAADNIVPILYVLQPLSPYVDRRSESYVEGAEPGDLYLKGAPEEYALIKADPRVHGPAAFLLFQPCHFYKDVGEWLPIDGGGGGGKGFIQRHDVEDEKDVPGAIEQKRYHWTTGDGVHELVGSSNHVGYAYVRDRAFPFLIPLSSTGKGVSRKWMSQINNQIYTEGQSKGKKRPSWSRLYYLTTEQRKNDQGRWFSIVTREGPWADKEQYDAGKKLNMQFKSGELKAGVPDTPSDEATGDGGQGGSTDALA